MKHTTFGDMGAQYVLLAPTAVADTNPHQVVDDLMGFDGAGLVLVTTGTLAGAWTFQGINGWQPGGINNNLARPGVSGNVSTLASPALAAVLTGGSSQAVQLVPFMWGALGITFTATSGSGNIAVYRTKKGNS